MQEVGSEKLLGHPEQQDGRGLRLRGQLGPCGAAGLAGAQAVAPSSTLELVLCEGYPEPIPSISVLGGRSALAKENSVVPAAERGFHRQSEGAA